MNHKKAQLKNKNWGGELGLSLKGLRSMIRRYIIKKDNSEENWVLRGINEKKRILPYKKSEHKLKQKMFLPSYR